MKRAILIISAICLMTMAKSQNQIETNASYKMKLNAGIVTEKLAESKVFYTELLNFGITFENEFYLLLQTPNDNANLAFLLPNHPTQQVLFHKPYPGEGMFLTIEVDNVDELYKEIKQKGVKIEIEIRDEPWGDRHFAVRDPNGIGIDIVKYSPPDSN